MSYKKLTRMMRKEISRNKKLKDLINFDEWGYRKNSPEFIELVNKNTDERLVLNKDEYSIKGF